MQMDSVKLFLEILLYQITWLKSPKFIRKITTFVMERYAPRM